MSRPRLATLHRLTRQDAGYLHRETADQPMHVVLLMDVEPGAGPRLQVEDVRAQVRSRLASAPWLRRKVRRAPGGIGPSVWVDDPTFDITRHVVDWPVHSDSDEAVRESVAALLRQRMSRDRPLWQLLVGAPRTDGRTPVAFLFHHAMMDGGLVSLCLDKLFGPASSSPPDEPGWHPARPPAAIRLLAIGVVQRVRARLTRRRRGAVVTAKAGGPGASGGGLSGPVGPQRVVALRRLSLEQVQRLRQLSGATINDLYVSACASALRELLDRLPAEHRATELLALVPRDVRSTGDQSTGNQTWSMLVRLPMSAASERSRLAVIQQATLAAKADTSSAGNAGFAFDVALSNVRLHGPHAIGPHPIGDVYTTAPLQGSNRLLAVAMSHGDAFTVAFTADPAVFPDLEQVADDTVAAFRRLQREVQVTSAVEQA